MDYWLVAQASHPKQCTLRLENYIECLHHVKEVHLLHRDIYWWIESADWSDTGWMEEARKGGKNSKRLDKSAVFRGGREECGNKTRIYWWVYQAEWEGKVTMGFIDDETMDIRLVDDNTNRRIVMNMSAFYHDKPRLNGNDFFNGSIFDSIVWYRCGVRKLFTMSLPRIPISSSLPL